MSTNPASSRSNCSLSPEQTLLPDSLALDPISDSAECPSLRGSPNHSEEAFFNPWENPLPQDVERSLRSPSLSPLSNPSPCSSLSQLPRPSPTATHSWLSTPDNPTGETSPNTGESTLWSPENTMKGTCSAKKVSEKDPSPCTITLTAIICDGDMYQATFSVEGDPDNGLSVNNRTRRLGRACIEYLENRFDNFGPFLETYDNLIGDKANGVPQPGCIKCTIRPPGSVETGEQTGSEDEAEATVVTETGTVFGRLHMNEKGTELTLQIWCPEDNNVRSCLPRDKGKSLSQVVDAIVASWRSLRDTWRQNAADASPS